MSSGSSVSRARSADLSEVLNDSVRTRQTARQTAAKATQVVDARFANIAANVFYQIMGDTSKSPEEQKAAITVAWTVTGNKEQDRARAKEFETFKEYLQQLREEMATEIIRLTDTEAFSELKKVYDDLNTALLDFNNEMAPLTDIIDAIYKLRTGGLTMDAFKEIQEDKKREEALAKELAEKTEEEQRVTDELNRLSKDIIRLREQKTLWGFGGIKESARVEIAEKTAVSQEKAARQAALDAEITEIEQRKTETTSKLGELAFAKDKLRELLDISSGEHIERQKRLVASALNFVTTTKARVGSVRNHLDKMGEQVEGLGDANTNMTRMYAIMNEGLKDAEGINHEKRAALMPPEGVEEDLITRTTREDQKSNIETHLKSLQSSATDTMQTYADLTSQTIRIKTMAEANESQVNRVKAMHSQGVASVADRLSTVLQSVSAAALNEASAAAKDTMKGMQSATDKVAQQDAIKIAMGGVETRDDLVRSIESLAAYGEVLDETTNITRESVAEMRQNLEELQRLATNVQGSISENIAVHAEVSLGVKRDGAPASSAPASPFGLKK